MSLRRGSAPPITVTQSGIIAGNAYFNDLIINHFADTLQSPFPPSANGILHAISMPAWDVLDISVGEVGSLDEPVWNIEAAKINSRFTSRRHSPFNFATARRRLPSDTVQPQSPAAPLDGLFEGGATAASPSNPTGSRGLSAQEAVVRTVVRFSKRFGVGLATLSLVRRVFRSFAMSAGWAIAGLRIRTRGKWVHLSNGAMQRPIPHPSRWGAVNVLLEHGTVRWSWADATGDALERFAYRRFCEGADHLWVTNLDVRTLELAETMCSGRWSAIPHPYVLDRRAPYAEPAGVRDALQRRTGAEFLIFSGSSLSLSGDQDKGTGYLIDAISILTLELGLPIGLVVAHWGADAEAVRGILRERGLDRCVAVVPPMSRVRMQRVMAACDLASDQFRLDAFGGLAIRALEQGMPVLTRGISEDAVRLIGEPPPFLNASSAATIADQVVQQLDRLASSGRESYRDHHRIASRGWLLRRHHHTITARLQNERYVQLTRTEPTPALPHAWALIPDWHGAE